MQSSRYNLHRYLSLHFSSDNTHFCQISLATMVLYTPATVAIKFSILLLYRRLFPNKLLKTFAQSIAGFLVLFALSQPLSIIIVCTPVAAAWDPSSYPDATCDNHTLALLLFAIMNACIDLLILVLPLPIIYRLQVTPTKKRLMIFMFLLGGL